MFRLEIINELRSPVNQISVNRMSFGNLEENRTADLAGELIADTPIYFFGDKRGQNRNFASAR